MAAVIAMDTKMEVTVGSTTVAMEARFRAAIHFVARVEVLKVCRKSRKVAWEMERVERIGG